MTAQHSLELGRKLAIAKQLIGECQGTMSAMMDNGQSDPISPDELDTIRRLSSTLKYELRAATGMCDSIGFHDSNWPTPPEELVTFQFEGDQMKGFDSDLVATFFF